MITVVPKIIPVFGVFCVWVYGYILGAELTPNFFYSYEALPKLFLN